MIGISFPDTIIPSPINLIFALKILENNINPSESFSPYEHK